MSETWGRGTGSFGFWRAGCIERCKSGSGRGSGKCLNKASRLSTSLARFRVRVPGHPPILTSSCLRGGFFDDVYSKKADKRLVRKTLQPAIPMTLTFTEKSTKI
jgi:hypothetical protein